MKSMKFHQRNARSQGYTYFKPLTVLPPRDAFAAHADVLEAYDTMVTLNTAIKDNEAAASSKRRQADEAAATYKLEVAAALAAGKDAAKVKNPEPQLRAEAQAHDTFATEARLQAERHGYTLGNLMREVAPECFAVSEQQLTGAAAEIRLAIEHLEKAWLTWATAWNLRLRLSHMHMTGGMQTSFRPGTVPVEVGTAIAALNSELQNLDQLKEDEAEMARWRAEQEAAQAVNRTGVNARKVTAAFRKAR